MHIFIYVVGHIADAVYNKNLYLAATQNDDQILTFYIDYCLMQVKRILSTFIKLPFVIKTFLLSIV